MRRATRPLRVLISSGPTREPIDPIRFISNQSTGYMGAQLAAEAIRRGHRVTVVSGPSTEPLPTKAQVIPVQDARDMERALRREAKRVDAIVMAAAVSDFRPLRASTSKLPRRRQRTLRLMATPDIIARLPRRPQQLIVGFALETHRVVARASRKMQVKQLDLVLAQQVNGDGSPFGRKSVRAWLLDRCGKTIALGRRTKAVIARVLLDKIEALWYGQQGFREALHATKRKP